MALQSQITALIWIIGALCERGVSWLLCCFSAETMEKLLKREKEVSTLTSQVEALKSQIGGKQARSALFPSSPTSLFFQRFRDKISWNIEFLRRHCVFHVQVFHFRIKRGEAWYFPAAFPSSLGFKLRTCQLSLSINKKIKKYACLCGDWRLYFPTVTPSSSRGGTCSSPLHSLIVTQKYIEIKKKKKYCWAERVALNKSGKKASEL